MHWTDRQRAMLREIGVRVWVPTSAPRVLGSAVAKGDAGADVAVIDAAPPQQPTAARAATPVAAAATHGLREPAETANDPRTRAERIAAMDWTSLRESAAACTACELHRGRTHSVFASAPGQADWLVVGDPPSADDDREGTPITGEAGRLLDNMLGAVRLSRASTALGPMKACVTTVVKCRPPNDRAADASEIATCEPYLRRQIELVQPRVVFAMGRCAAQGTVTGNEPVGKLRGAVHRGGGVPGGVPVVVTFHPNHLARHAADKAKAWEDLCRAIAVVDEA